MTTVLVVDDMAVDRRLAGGLLEQSGNFEIQYAENGLQAFDMIQQSAPDLVVTDMQMPEMDGLELVMKIRLAYPQVPVVLMTAAGSEDIAIEALERGASSYVPKSRLGDKLTENVEQLLSLADAEQSYVNLMACQDEIGLKFTLSNDFELIDALVALVQQIVAGMDFTDHTGKYRIGVAVREALANAMFRGNLELSKSDMLDESERLLSGQELGLVDQRRSEPPYADRRIHVALRIENDEARYVIRDDGRGFDHQAEMAHHDNRETIGGASASQGQGLVLMRSFMDEVLFNEAGNEVTMIKRRDVDAD